MRMGKFLPFTALSFIVVVAYYLVAGILLDAHGGYLMAPLLFGQVVPTALSLGISIALGYWKREGTWIKRLLVTIAAFAMPYATILPAMYLSCSLGDVLSCLGSSG
jgi:putative effector of murein hydrolase